MAKTTKPSPAFTIRDGRLKITCWANTTAEKKTFHSVELVKSYQDDKEEWKDTTSLSGTDLLKAQNLYARAYNKINELNATE